MLTPIALMKALVPGMMARGWGRVVNITSQSVKAPIPVLGLSNSARTGLTGYVAGTSRQVAPERRDRSTTCCPASTPPTGSTRLIPGVAEAQGISLEEAKIRQAASHHPPGRYGTRGGVRRRLCAFCAAEHAGFIIGQNILLDGGAVNATL